MALLVSAAPRSLVRKVASSRLRSIFVTGIVPAASNSKRMHRSGMEVSRDHHACCKYRPYAPYSSFDVDEERLEVNTGAQRGLEHR